MGYQTLIGDMGTVLSGGQKQRVLLARALYKQPKILILDEATSHLDVLCERQVSDAISRLAITRLIVAHRPETIASADRVCSLQTLVARTRHQHSGPQPVVSLSPVLPGREHSNAAPARPLQSDSPRVSDGASSAR